jgi:hypothetical protein
MAQANESREPGKGGLERFTFRTIALIVGLIGVVLVLVVNILYSLAHVLGRIAGFSNDPGHFFWGLLVVLVGIVGAFLAPILPLVSAVLLLGAGIGFFFVVGWWAVIASPFLIVAAILTFSNRPVKVPGVG